jgi:hypothetical protein
MIATNANALQMSAIAATTRASSLDRGIEKLIASNTVGRIGRKYRP